MRRSLLVLVTATALTLGACTDSTGGQQPSEPPTETAEPTDESTEEPTDDATDEPEPSDEPEPTEPDGEPFTDANETTHSEGFFDQLGSDLELVAIEQPSPDRVEITLGGNDEPQWHAQFTDEPVTQGAGLPVELDDPWAFELVVSGFAMPEGDWEVETPNTNIAVDPPFEGQIVVYIGQTEPQDYRVTLTDTGITVEFATD